MRNFRVRPLSHLGLYPSPPLALGDDMIFEQHGLLFSCSQNRMISEHGYTRAEQPGFELNNWTSREVRFFTAIYLGRGWCLGAPYPLPLEQDVFASTSERVAADPVLTKRLARNLSNDDHWMRGNQSLLPSSVDHYHLDQWSPEQTARASTIWQSFDLANPVLVRGMAVLLKSEMLSQHFQFCDASLAMVHIAMDAAHSMVLNELRNEGVANPSSLDAGRWVDQALGYQPTGDKFLQDWYEDRIRNFHPESRFGADAIPFFFADDIFDLTHILKEIFYFLITREVYRERW